MAVDFGILAQAPSIGRSFMAGREAAQAEQERNMLRQQQAEQMQFQRENMLAQRDERLAQRQRQAELDAKIDQMANLIQQHGMDPDDPKVLSDFMGAAMATRNPQLIQFVGQMTDRAAQRRAAREEQTRIGNILSPTLPPGPPLRQPTAPVNALAAPRQDLLAGTPFAIGPLAAPAAQPAPAAAPDNTAKIADLERQIDALEAMGTPAALAQAKRLERTVEKLRPKQETTPADIATMKALGLPITPEGYARFAGMRKPEGTKVEVKLPEQEKAFETELGKGQAKKLIDDKAAAEDARGIISTIEEGRRLLKSGVITGFGADFLTGLGAALNQAGINFAEDSVANTQAFTANMAANVGRIIKQFGAGTGLSNADREYAEKMAGGKVTLDRKSIERILDINERMARNVIALHNRNAAKVKTNIPLTVEEPGRLSPQDQQALDWANANPTDPRSATIKQRLGAR